MLRKIFRSIFCYKDLRVKEFAPAIILIIKAVGANFVRPLFIKNNRKRENTVLPYEINERL